MSKFLVLDVFGFPGSLPRHKGAETEAATPEEAAIKLAGPADPSQTSELVPNRAWSVCSNPPPNAGGDLGVLVVKLD